jgi:tetratricopeptide (TPR) repeat protein
MEAPDMKNQLVELRATLEISPAAVDVESYFHTAMEAEDAHLEQAIEAFGAGDLQRAISLYGAVREMNEGLINVIGELSGTTDEGQAALLARERATAESGVLFMNGMIEMVEGLRTNIEGAIYEARDHFSTAKTILKRLQEQDPDAFVYAVSVTAEVNELCAIGRIETIRGNHATAAAKFQQASSRIRHVDESLPADGEDGHDPAADLFLEFVRSEAIMIEVLFHRASTRVQSAKGNTKAALEHSQKLIDLVSAHMTGLPEAVPEWLRRVVEAQSHAYHAQHHLLEGQARQEGGEWDLAISAFESARTDYEASANTMLSSGLQRAEAFQETLLQQGWTAVDVAIRQCEAQQRLTSQLASLEEELNALREGLRSSLKEVGFTFNNTAEAISEVKQRISVTQQVETVLEKGFDDLRHAVRDSEIDRSAQEDILAKLDEVQSEEVRHEPAKRRRLMEHVTLLLQSSEKVAAPLIGLAIMIKELL